LVLVPMRHMGTIHDCVAVPCLLSGAITIQSSNQQQHPPYHQNETTNWGQESKRLDRDKALD
jgi:hypothetical protein